MTSSELISLKEPSISKTKNNQLDLESEKTQVVLITNDNINCKIERIDVVPNATGRTVNVFLDVTSTAVEQTLDKTIVQTNNQSSSLCEVHKKHSHVPKGHPTRRTIELAVPRQDLDTNCRVCSISQSALLYNATPRIVKLSQPKQNFYDPSVSVSNVSKSKKANVGHKRKVNKHLLTLQE